VKTFIATETFVLEKGVVVARGAKVQLPDRIAKKFSKALIERKADDETLGRNKPFSR